MSEAPSPSDLTRLAARTRELVLDLEATRADVLSVADLNRALRQVLRNQVAIIDWLAGSQAPRPDGATAAAIGTGPRPDGATAAGIGTGSQAPTDNAPPARQAASQAPSPPQPVGEPAPSASAAQRRLSEPLVFEPDEPAHAAGTNGTASVAPLAEPAASASLAAEAATAAPAADVSLAEQVLRETRVVPTHIARSVVEAFDNRDNSYEKGLDKLNRWVSGGAGTPFQWRGDRAYLNLNGAGAASVKNYEEQLMSRMGFSRRLGRLVVPGLQGEVIIYERPG